MSDTLKRNLESVAQRMARACVRAGRGPGDVKLVAVTKTVGPDLVRELQALGVTDVGENRVQEAHRKFDALDGDLGLRWHMIGHVQTNKVRHVLGRFALIHSLDSLRLARAIQARADRDGLDVPVLIQVNTSGEESKFGIAPDDLDELLEGVMGMDRLRLEGLMTMAPFVDDAELTRPCFAALRSLADVARRATGLAMPHLSMGMTQDFEVAIEEGATLVRIGSALFRGLD